LLLQRLLPLLLLRLLLLQLLLRRRGRKILLRLEPHLPLQLVLPLLLLLLLRWLKWLLEQRLLCLRLLLSLLFLLPRRLLFRARRRPHSRVAWPRRRLVKQRVQLGQRRGGAWPWLRLQNLQHQWRRLR